LTKFPI